MVAAACHQTILGVASCRKEEESSMTHHSPLVDHYSQHINPRKNVFHFNLQKRLRLIKAFINLRIGQIHHVLIQVVRNLHLLPSRQPFAQRVGSFEANAAHYYVAGHEVATGQHHARLLDAFDHAFILETMVSWGIYEVAPPSHNLVYEPLNLP